MGCRGSKPVYPRWAICMVVLSLQPPVSFRCIPEGLHMTWRLEEQEEVSEDCLMAQLLGFPNLSLPG